MLPDAVCVSVRPNKHEVNAHEYRVERIAIIQLSDEQTDAAVTVTVTAVSGGHSGGGAFTTRILIALALIAIWALWRRRRLNSSAGCCEQVREACLLEPGARWPPKPYNAALPLELHG
jgi:hypothetical protein